MDFNTQTDLRVTFDPVATDAAGRLPGDLASQPPNPPAPPRPMADPPAESYDWRPAVLAARERHALATNGRISATPMTPRARMVIDEALAPLIAAHPDVTWIRQLSGACGIVGSEWEKGCLVTAGLAIPKCIERPASDTDWRAYNVENFLLADAVALALDPHGPVREIERREAILLREMEQRAAELRRLQEEQARQIARRARWDLLPHAAQVALAGAAQHPADSTEGRVLRLLFALSLDVVQNRDRPELPPDLDELLDRVAPALKAHAETHAEAEAEKVAAAARDAVRTYSNPIPRR